MERLRVEQALVDKSLVFDPANPVFHTEKRGLPKSYVGATLALR
jgi:hypothetical protein